MKWRKLLYGKGDASRGLWHDTAAYLVTLGSHRKCQCINVVCLCTRSVRLISVCTWAIPKPTEASADGAQTVQWLQDRFAERYTIKWLGFNGEKSRTLVGIRTEMTILTRSLRRLKLNCKLIRKAATRFGWDEHRKRFSPPVHNKPFPKLEAGATVEAKLHKRFDKRPKSKHIVDTAM